MGINQTETKMQPERYKISVVIPLYDKRISEEECFKSWCHQQSLDEHTYEVIAVSNGDSADDDARVKKLLRGHDQFISLPGGNMSELYDLGARSARSDLPFLTELHCVANQDFLEKVLEYMAANDVDGACTQTIDGVENTFGQVEASLFRELFNEWSKDGDWRKVLVRGVAIKKEKYIAAGGINGQYPRFADWVLAAKLDDLGCKLGFASEASLVHYYSTSYAQFFPAVRVHIIDECVFRDSEDEKFCTKYFGIHKDWSLRSTYSRGWQYKILKSQLRLLASPRLWFSSFKKMLGLFCGLVTTAINVVAGLYPKLFLYKLKIHYYHLLCELRRNDFKKLKITYIKAHLSIEDFYRLEYLANHDVAQEKPVPQQQRYVFSDMESVSLPGFYSVEHHEDISFRWCSNAAEIIMNLPVGDYRLILDTKSIAGDPHKRLLGMFFNNHLVEVEIDRLSSGVIAIRIFKDMFNGEGVQRLKILTSSINLSFNSEEIRKLGIPLVSLECEVI